MNWVVGMKDEKDSRETYLREKREKLLTEGIHDAEILTVQIVPTEESKSGNPYFKWKLQTDEGNIDVITTLLKGKRWLLKQMLLACGIEANPEDEEQKYSFSEKDVLGKKVKIKVYTDSKPFTGRDGVPITSPKSVVRQVMNSNVEIEEPSTEETSATETVNIPF